MTTKVKVLRLIHHTHPAPTQLPQHAIMRDGLADHMQFLFGGWYVEGALSSIRPRCASGGTRHLAAVCHRHQSRGPAATLCHDLAVSTRRGHGILDKSSAIMKLRPDDL